MGKKIIFSFIIIFTFFIIGGGFFYFLKERQTFFNKPLFASLAEFLSFGPEQKKKFPFSEELAVLNQKISFLEESLNQRQERLEKLDDLIEKFEDLDQRIIQLEAVVKNFGQRSFDSLEEKENPKGERKVELKENLGDEALKTPEKSKEKTKEKAKKKSEEKAKDEQRDVCSVNINTASKTELEKISGIGPVLAQRIIEARPFYSLSDLKKVEGIGDKTFQGIIEQGCAYVDELYFAGPIIPSIKGGSPPSPPSPTITLSFPQESQVNKEIKVHLSVSNLKIAPYDIKISIEKDRSISQICQIYNQTEEDWQCPEGQWQSSFNYLTNIFEGTGFSGNFLLKISEDKSDFRGEADIIARVRENGKTNYLAEFQGKINITEPEEEEPESEQPASNLLLNEFFDDWEEPGNTANHLHNWDYSGTATHLSRDGEALVGKYSARWTPITSANNLTQTNITITKPGTYYAEIWIKILNVDANNYIRVALDIADPQTGNFPSANFTDYQTETGWVKLIKTREIETGEKGGLRIRAQRSGSKGPFLLVGSAWFGLKTPPKNWPF